MEPHLSALDITSPSLATLILFSQLFINNEMWTLIFDWLAWEISLSDIYLCEYKKYIFILYLQGII